jgi:hypothetical protein
MQPAASRSPGCVRQCSQACPLCQGEAMPFN